MLAWTRSTARGRIAHAPERQAQRRTWRRRVPVSEPSDASQSADRSSNLPITWAVPAGAHGAVGSGGCRTRVGANLGESFIVGRSSPTPRSQPCGAGLASRRAAQPAVGDSCRQAEWSAKPWARMATEFPTRSAHPPRVVSTAAETDPSRRTRPPIEGLTVSLQPTMATASWARRWGVRRAAVGVDWVVTFADPVPRRDHRSCLGHLSAGVGTAWTL
jgi:hypothetical protein